MASSRNASVASGIARSTGPSAQEVLSRDPGGAPAHLLEESYRFLGDEDIDFSRYTSREFFAREMSAMWPRVWQWACRESEIAEPGDYSVYDIGDRSILIVRTEEGRIKAYHNVCLHRGTQLKPRGTNGYSPKLRCRFHGFTWSLDGKLIEVPCQWDFPHIEQRDFSLPEVRVDTWGGAVFINLDPDAPPLLEYLGVISRHFENWRLDEKFVSVHIRKVLPANWKACIEAFLEAFHVLETHPQGLLTVGDANSQYDIYGDHVSRFVHLLGIQSPHIKDQRSEQEILDALLNEGVVEEFGGAKQDPQSRLTVPAGGTARQVFAEHIKRAMGGIYRKDLSHLTITETIDALQYFVFPNLFLFPSVLFPMVYRFRPNGTDVDSTVFDLLYLQPLPDDGTRPEDAQPVDLRADQSYHDVPGFDPGLATVYDQDTGNLESQQLGFKASEKPGQTLGNYQEIRVRQLHRTLDKYLQGGPGGPDLVRTIF